MINPHKTVDLKSLDQVEAYRVAKSTLADLYTTDEGKKFVHHLVYAFNASTLKFIIFSKATLFDCLTKSALRTVSTKDEPVPDTIRDLYSRIPNSVSEDEKVELEKELYNQVGKYTHDCMITRCALRSDHTNKLLGTDEYQALMDFAIEQANAGSEVLIKMIKYLRPDLMSQIKRSKKPTKKFNKRNSGEITQSQLEALKNKFNVK